MQWRRFSSRGAATVALVCWVLSFGAVNACAQSAADVQHQAEAGNAAAQFRLGSMYASGTGVAQDDAKAFEWFSKSAEQGNLDAMSMLSLMYGAGRGVKHDFSTAYVWAVIADRLAPQTDRAKYDKSKREMASWLSAAQIAAADGRVEAWLKEHHLHAEGDHAGGGRRRAQDAAVDESRGRPHGARGDAAVDRAVRAKHEAP
jgi:TPR repeat protein